jgi:hypothetical protein
MHQRGIATPSPGKPRGSVIHKEFVVAMLLKKWSHFSHSPYARASDNRFPRLLVEPSHCLPSSP